MGQVWLARHHESRELGALKVLPPDPEPAEVARFERERHILAALSHPALVRLLDTGSVDGAPYLVMTYVPGESLDHRLRDGRPLPLARCVPVFADLAFGLAHAHDQGIQHRDIKAENVVVRTDGWASLVDFGIALKRGSSRVTLVGQVLGTVSYLAPEIVAGHPHDPVKADIYALGQLLYEALTGEPAFRASRRLRHSRSRVNQVLHAKLKATALDPGEEFDEALRDLVRQATSPRPADRTTSAEDLAHGLTALLSSDARNEVLVRIDGGTDVGDAPWVDVLTVPRIRKTRRKTLWMGIWRGAFLTALLLAAIGAYLLVMDLLPPR